MRILAVSTDYPPQSGGIARLSAELCRAWSEAGHSVRVVAAGRGPRAREFDGRQPYPTRRAPATLGLRELGVSAWLAREVADFRPEVVWAAVWFPGAVAASYLGWLGSFQLSLSAHGAEILPYSHGWRQLLKNRLHGWRRRVLTRSRVVFAISRFTRDRLLELGAPPERVLIVPGGVSREWFQPRHPPPGPGMLLTVARLDENKGHDVVIEALPRLPGVRYVLVGPGDGWPRLERLAARAGVLERVEYRGLVGDAELKALYASATAFVLASREIPGRLVEGFGLTLLEAAAAGLPAVAGRSGGIADAVEHEVSGLLVEPESPEAVAAAVRRLLDQPEWAWRLGEQARERARGFLWERAAQRMVSAWQAD